MSKVTDEMVQAFNIACWDRQRDHLPDLRAGIQALFDAKLISLPVDEAAIRESVVRECIAAFDDVVGQVPVTFVRGRLNTLLPTKDRAKELADEYWRETHGQDPRDGQMLVRAVNFARWLIEREG